MVLETQTTRTLFCWSLHYYRQSTFVFFSIKLLELISVPKEEVTLQTTIATLSLCYN